MGLVDFGKRMDKKLPIVLTAPHLLMNEGNMMLFFFTAMDGFEMALVLADIDAESYRDGGRVEYYIDH